MDLLFAQQSPNTILEVVSVVERLPMLSSKHPLPIPHQISLDILLERVVIHTDISIDFLHCIALVTFLELLYLRVPLMEMVSIKLPFLLKKVLESKKYQLHSL